MVVSNHLKEVEHMDLFEDHGIWSTYGRMGAGFRLVMHIVDTFQYLNMNNQFKTLGYNMLLLRVYWNLKVTFKVSELNIFC